MNRSEESKTLQKGLAILEAIAGGGSDGLKIAEVSSLTHIPRSSIYRFIDVLVANGYIRELNQGRRYLLNESKLLFTKHQTESEALQQLKSLMVRVSQNTGDSSFLVAMEDCNSLCIHREIGTYPVQVLSVAVNHRQPLGVGAAGLSLLTSLSASEQERVLQLNESVLDNYGRMSVKKMKLLIKATHDRGFAVVANSAVIGVVGVGIAIADKNGIPRYGLSVSSIEQRFPLSRQKEVAKYLIEEVSRLKGFKYI